MQYAISWVAIALISYKLLQVFFNPYGRIIHCIILLTSFEVRKKVRLALDLGVRA